jgi:endo-1,4-beta-xylanase
LTPEAQQHPPTHTPNLLTGAPGPPRTVNFDATLNATGNNYLTVYGWTNPQTEYYIIESSGTFDPTQYIQKFGTYEDADGSTYNLGREIRYSQIPMEGTTLTRIFAVRQNPRLSGSVDVGAHLEAWKAKGLKPVGSPGYLIMGIEGYQSSGEADVTVW